MLKQYFWQTDRVFNLDNCSDKKWFDTAQFVKSTAPRASIGFFNNLQIFTPVNLFVFQIAGGIK